LPERADRFEHDHIGAALPSYSYSGGYMRLRGGNSGLMLLLGAIIVILLLVVVYFVFVVPR
jgi:uncharacterized membrane protein